MPQFRKKPITITAEQFTGPASISRGDVQDAKDPSILHLPPVPDGVTWREDPEYGVFTPVVRTIEGTFHVGVGDFIAKFKGVAYPMNQDVFKETYEEVEEAPKVEDVVTEIKACEPPAEAVAPPT